jgi:ABC-type multidrug transport system fused ATPase/permease subunit
MNGSENRQGTVADRRLIESLRIILWQWWGRLATIVVLIVVASLLEGASFSLLVPLTQSFTEGSAGSGGGPVLFQAYQRWLDGYELNERLAVLAVALVGLFGLKNLLQYVRAVLSTRLSLDMTADMRVKALEAVLHRPYQYFLVNKQGTLVHQLYHETHHVAYVVQTGIEQVANVVAVSALIVLLLVVSWQVTAIVFLVGTAYGLVMWRISRQANSVGAERQRCESEAMAVLAESVAGIRQVKVFSGEARVRSLYEQWVQRFRQQEIHHWSRALLPQPLTEIFWIAVLGVLLSFPMLGIIPDAKAVLPLVTVFSAVAFRVGPYVSRMTQGWLTAKYYLPSFRLVSRLLEATEPALSRSRERKPFQLFARSIQLERVGFSYDGASPALSGVSVSFNRGETTAVIGPSGAGKSTLVDLLIRLYEPTSGRIVVDGTDLADYELGSWLARIGFVSQDTFVFHATILENIAFGKPGASLEEIQAAARQAHAHDFIERLPNGYDTMVGDRGLTLSGGQRQRIAIARALVRDPEILIFDEATSALDNQSEALVQEAIATLAKTRTVIIVAHRLSTVVHADKIIVLDHGKVAEEGTHAALLGSGSVYSNLYGRGRGS